MCQIYYDDDVVLGWASPAPQTFLGSYHFLAHGGGGGAGGNGGIK